MFSLIKRILILFSIFILLNSCSGTSHLSFDLDAYNISHPDSKVESIDMCSYFLAYSIISPKREYIWVIITSGVFWVISIAYFLGNISNSETSWEETLSSITDNNGKIIARHTRTHFISSEQAKLNGEIGAYGCVYTLLFSVFFLALIIPYIILCLFLFETYFPKQTNGLYVILALLPAIWIAVGIFYLCKYIFDFLEYHEVIDKIIYLSAFYVIIDLIWGCIQFLYNKNITL